MSQKPSTVRWWYYIPHEWDGETTTWEDIYLLPDLADWEHESLWLTVDAAGALAEGERERLEIAARLIEVGYVLDREKLDMFIPSNKFTKPELINWARVAIHDLGLPCGELVEGTREMFADSNDHARAALEAKRRLEEYESKNDPSGNK